MPLEPGRAVRYSPSIDEIMEDMNIASPNEFREKILSKCRSLYASAGRKRNLSSFGTPHTFILCNSSEFYQTLVNLGHGNAALVICDDLSSDVYFLLFKDKVPKKLQQIVASHEVREYSLVRSGVNREIAHKEACCNEIDVAKKLGLKKPYMRFLKKNYPGKLRELREQYSI